MQKKRSKTLKVKKTIIKKERIKKSHIKKIGKMTNIEDIFMLSANFKEEDNEKLYELIKKENKGKKNSSIDKNILKIIREDKDSKNLKEDICQILIEEIENHYQDLKEKGAEKRKKGEDTLLGELKLMSIQYKLKLFKATKDKRDYLKIKKIFLDIEKEFN